MMVGRAQGPIAVVYQGCYPDPHGLMAGVRRVRDFAQGLHEAGAESRLLCPSHFAFGANDPGDAFDIVHLGNHAPRPSLRSRLSFWQGVRDYVVRENVSACLFYNTTLDSLPCIRRLRILGYTVGLEVCDLFSMMKWSLWKKWLYRITEYQLPKQSTVNIAISSGIQKWFQKVAPRTPSFIVPGLYDGRAFQTDKDAGKAFRQRWNVAENECLFVYTGSWYKIKGLEAMLRAFASLYGKAQRVRLIITGKKSNPRFDVDVEGWVQKLGIQEVVGLTGYLDNQQISAALSAADVLVCPHEEDRFSNYAFPTKMAEYAGMGKAILATRVGDIPLYFNDNQDIALCPPGDVDAMSEKMAWLSERADRRRELGVRARQTALRCFDYRTNGVRLRQILSEPHLAI